MGKGFQPSGDDVGKQANGVCFQVFQLLLDGWEEEKEEEEEEEKQYLSAYKIFNSLQYLLFVFIAMLVIQSFKE